MDAKNELLQMLETSIVTLLNKVQNNSWSLLIFQTLLWSFRRWAIHYLMSSEPTDLMKDYVWESHLDLVRQFAPVELKDFGIIWLNPTNVGSRVDILEELNDYFLKVVDALDEAIKTDNEEAQNTLAIFLDDDLTAIVDKWLDGKNEYRIYPKADQSPDSFSPSRIYEIMRLIMDEPVPEPLSVVEPVAVVEPVVEPLPEEPEVAPETVKEALARRRSTRKTRPKGAPKTRKRKVPKA
jgi:hypothetical protein